ncbi:MAG TPA: carboxypeptidase-like regulatory domain-containing protein, partial [Saprospiraceae bacterium]|nr:carboxypeptidase-like regulatory domain-containing protein [Saprospiraceae bacterium]
MKSLLTTFVLTALLNVVGFSQRTISGKVTDPSGEPLIGANIVAKESPTVGTVTDLDGTYSLTVPNGATALIFSYTGYTTKEIAITSSNVY